MTTRTPRVCAAIALATVGCSYDWSSPAASDAGVVDAGLHDATIPEDAAPDALVDASDGGSPGIPDTGSDAAFCLGLIANAETLYGLISQSCTSPGNPCPTVKDQCGCKRSVGDEASSQTSAYEEAVQTILQDGCAVCEVDDGSVSCPAALMCLSFLGDGGGLTYACE
jgi:hypothetical protein